MTTQLTINDLKKIHPNHLEIGREVFRIDHLNNVFSIGLVTMNEKRPGHTGNEAMHGYWHKIETELQRIDGLQYVWVRREPGDVLRGDRREVRA